MYSILNKIITLSSIISSTGHIIWNLTNKSNKRNKQKITNKNVKRSKHSLKEYKKEREGNAETQK